MEIEELLVAIGIDTSQAAKIQEVVVALGAAAVTMANEANKINGDLDTIGESAAQGAEEAGKKAEEAGRSMSKLKMIAVGVGAVIGFVSGKVLGFLDSAIAGAQNLSKEKGLLFDISKQELQQADEYQEAMKKTGLSIESIKTKIALNLVPQLTAITQKFNDWLGANKELIAAGLTKVIQWAGRFFRVIINTGRAIWKVIDSTIGWRGALILLAAAFAILNRSMLMSPITWVIAAIVGLMLVIDDLMGYLDGKESQFGEFWGACIGWIKDVIAWWNEFYTNNKEIIDGITGAFVTMVDSIISVFSGLFSYFKNVLKLILGIFTGDTDLMSEAWSGMAEDAMKVFDGLIQFFSGFFDLLGSLWAGLLKTVSKVWSSIMRVIRRVFDWIKNGVKTAVNAVKTTFLAVVDFIAAPFRNGWNLVKKLFDIWGNDSSSFTDKIKETFEAVVKFVSEPFEKAFKAIEKAFDAVMNWIRNGLDEIENSELMKKIRENPELSMTGGIRRMDFGMPPPKSVVNGGNQNSATYNVDVKQTINTNDAVKAAGLAVDGLTKELQKTARNTETTFASGI
ncbi:phage tail protein [Morganella sp. B601]|uniref:phage tail protein n=1 Tax=Morganella sp. B601 TaxID=3444315 RepID=UPI003EBF2E9B